MDFNKELQELSDWLENPETNLSEVKRISGVSYPTILTFRQGKKGGRTLSVVLALLDAKEKMTSGKT